MLGILISVSLFLLLASLLPALPALLLAVPPGLWFTWLFAFHRKENLSYATYLLYRRTFRKKTPRLINTLTDGKDFRNQPPLF